MEKSSKKKQLIITGLIALVVLTIICVVIINKRKNVGNINSNSVANKAFFTNVINNSKSLSSNIQINDDRKLIHASNYDMELVLDMQNQIISGHSQVKIVNKSDDEVDMVVLRNYAAGGTVSNFKDSNGNELSASLEDDITIVDIKLAEALKPQEETVISFDFETYVPKKNERFGYIQDGDKDIYQLSFCFPCLSVYKNGQWNKNPYVSKKGESNYSTVADYSVKISVPDDYTVVATGVENNDGNGNYNIEGKNLREFAMVVGNNLVKKTVNYNGIDISDYSYGFKGNEKYDAFTLQALEEAIILYSDIIGDYPYEDLDIVNVFIDGSMEFPGLIMLGYPDCRYINTLDEHEDYEYSLQKVAHEAAHQWFYGAIGNDPYNEPYLDEGFARFFEKCVFEISGTQVIEDVRNAERNSNLYEGTVKDFTEMNNMFLEQTKHDKGINMPLDKYTGNDFDYDYYVYDGTKFFLFELEQEMGEARFFAMIQDYYKNYKFKEVSTKEFLEFAKMYAGSKDVDEIAKKYFK